MEVYRSKYKPEKNYITYALYVMFFPQLVAGPIERPQHLLPQLSIQHKFNSTMARRGLERIAFGFFKKLVIADQFSQVVVILYTNTPADSMIIITMAILFTYQLYCDFSAYTDIAIGSAMLLGITLMENFNRPFSATSIADLWRRWHISLSSWLRDYLYYPMAFSWGRVTKIKLYFSMLFTFAIIGLWHGANWTYVVFGTLQGLYLILGHLTTNIRKKFVSIIRLDKIPALHRGVQQLTVFILFTFSLIFFRSDSLDRAFWFIRYIFSPIRIKFFIDQLKYYPTYTAVLGILATSVTAVIAMEIIQYYQSKKNTLYVFENKPIYIRYGWYYGLVFSIIFFGYFAGQSFIYFKF